MRSILTQQPIFKGLWFSGLPRLQRFPLMLMGLGIGVGLLGHPSPSVAQGNPTSDAELKSLLGQVDSAATRRDLNATLQFYSPTFKTTDGLDREALGRALSKFWEPFTQIQYQTQLLSWKREGGQVVVDTKTTINGVENISNRKLALSSTITSRQILSQGKLISQEILTEKTQLTSGSNPPKVEIRAPETVSPGTSFNFDAVLSEPLGENLVLGGVGEKTAQRQTYLEPDTSANVKLDILSAGGIFKVGEAPKIPQNVWISSFFIREEGLNMTTQRLRVKGK